jgi:hypothetical protein
MLVAPTFMVSVFELLLLSQCVVSYFDHVFLYWVLETSVVPSAKSFEESVDPKSSLDHSLLLLLREKERALRKKRKHLKDATQIETIEKEIEAIEECKENAKAAIRFQRAKGS